MILIETKMIRTFRNDILMNFIIPTHLPTGEAGAGIHKTSVSSSATPQSEVY